MSPPTHNDWINKLFTRYLLRYIKNSVLSVFSFNLFENIKVLTSRMADPRYPLASVYSGTLEWHWYVVDFRRRRNVCVLYPLSQAKVAWCYAYSARCNPRSLRETTLEIDGIGGIIIDGIGGITIDGDSLRSVCQVYCYQIKDSTLNGMNYPQPM